MENIEIPTGILIPQSALRKLQPHELQPMATSCNSCAQIISQSSNSSSTSTASLLEVYWNSIGAHVNATPEASLRSRFISALETDPLAQKPCDNPPIPRSWQDGLLLHDNLVYVPHDDALRVELMQTHHDDPLAGHYGVTKTLELLMRN